MADEMRMALGASLRKAVVEQDAEFLRGGVPVLPQLLLESQVKQHLGVEQDGRTSSRERAWSDRVVPASAITSPDGQRS